MLLDWLRASHAILARAGIETQVVGDMPDSLRRQLATDYPTLDVRGFVDDPSDLVLAARAGLIVDTLGGGFKLRLLSHVFERLPIIGLAEAIEGLPTAAGKGYLAAADHTALAHLLVDTIDDFDRLNDIMNTAFADCSGRFSWDSRATALIAALGGGGAASPRPGARHDRHSASSPRSAAWAWVQPTRLGERHHRRRGPAAAAHRA
ncbi:hypothetical protein ACFSHQ_24030 [Gemmobacter lanyuensis]